MPEDRDQLFEKALARHLRTESAGEPLCLDPETLAAYHERMLSPEELSSAKSHIVSCTRCQEILAQLEATQEVDEVEETNGTVPAVAFIAASSEPRGQATLRSLETVRSAAPEKVVAIPGKRFSSLRWAAPAGAIAAALLIWIGVRDAGILRKPSSEAPTEVSAKRQQAPATSAAEESKTFGLGKEKEAERRKSDAPSADQLNQVAPVPNAQPSLLDEGKDSAGVAKLEAQDTRPSSRNEYPPQSGMRSGHGPSAPSAQNQANNTQQRSDQNVLGGAKMAEAAPRPADLDLAETKKSAPSAKSGMATGAARPVPPAPAPAKQQPGRLRGTVTDPSGAAVAGANVQLQSESGRTVASTSTDSSGTYSFSGVVEGNYQLQLESAGFRTDILTGVNIQAGENVMNARLELGNATETVQVAGQAPVAGRTSSQVAEATVITESNSRSLRDLVLLSPGFRTAASPDGKAVWKFGEAGQIFHSTNAGKEWISQVSGVAVKLLAGSVPSAKVCWVAGATGTLLRTTDGGKHWQRINVPIKGDLGGVQASDANHASIWDAPNRVGYETSDGGQTWKPTANQ